MLAPALDPPAPLRWGLVGAAVLLQALAIALPLAWSFRYAFVASGALLAAGVALFSAERSLLLLVFLDIVLPDFVLGSLLLPGGLRFQEGMFLAVAFFALIDLVYRRGLAVRTSPADAPVLIFLAVVGLSTAVGLAHHNSMSLILRDVRFPLYYAAFFLATQVLPERTAARWFPRLLVLAGAVVGVAYIGEFLWKVGQAGQFVRVARLEGVVLPLGVLVIATWFLHGSGYRRLVLAGLLVPVGLALALTLGRGLWAALAAGLIAAILLHYRAQPVDQRRPVRTVMVVLGVMVAVVAGVLLVQRFTGANIGAHALERSRTLLDYQRDAPVMVRLLSYATALEAIGENPVLGGGQGAAITYVTLDFDTGLPFLWTAGTVDNLYLALLLKMGVVGLLAFGWLWLRMLKLAHRTYLRSQDRETRAFAAGMVAVLVGLAVLGVSDAAMVNGRLALVFGTLYGVIALTARAERV